MNIFVLDEDPKISAQYHCDKHVVKMILESAQLLSTAHRVLDSNLSADKEYIIIDSNKQKQLYKATHINHPCSIWTRESKNNYIWLYSLFTSLLEEYNIRYGYKKGKEHSCSRLSDILSLPPEKILDIEKTPWKLAMPNHCKVLMDNKFVGAVKSYRKYYALEKSQLLKYTNREKPSWLALLEK